MRILQLRMMSRTMPGVKHIIAVSQPVIPWCSVNGRYSMRSRSISPLHYYDCKSLKSMYSVKLSTLCATYSRHLCNRPCQDIRASHRSWETTYDAAPVSTFSQSTDSARWPVTYLANGNKVDGLAWFVTTNFHMNCIYVRFDSSHAMKTHNLDICCRHHCIKCPRDSCEWNFVLTEISHQSNRTYGWVTWASQSYNEQGHTSTWRNHLSLR